MLLACVVFLECSLLKSVLFSLFILDVLCNLELVTICDDAVFARELDKIGNVTTRGIDVALVVLLVVNNEVFVTTAVVLV